MSSDTVKVNPEGRHFSRDEWFTLPLAFRRRWWRETDYSRLPASDQLLTDLHSLLKGSPCPPRPAADDLYGLKAAMADAHPDKGGSSAAFIEARHRYVAARRLQRAGGGQC